MATLRQLPSGKWQVQIRRSGLPPVAKSFKGRNDAQAWARQIESEMDRGSYFDRAEAESTTIGDLIDRYLVEVTPLKKSASRETGRLRLLKRHFGSFSVVCAVQIDQAAQFE